MNNIYIYPTDTVWGIGGSVFDKNVVIEIARVKGTSVDKPLSVLFSSIEMVEEYFSFPDHISRPWLEDFFKLESTFCIPRSWLKKDIPEFVTAGSDLIGVRVITSSDLDRIFEITNSPIITTSLNKTGEAPIIKEEDALSFMKEELKDAQFINSINLVPSGHSSTFVKMDDGKFEIIRKGSLYNDVKNHMGLLAT